MAFNHVFRKKDDNHSQIARFFSDALFNVIDVSSLNVGFDLIVFKKNTIFLIEVKDGKKPASKQALTTLEKKAQGKFPDFYHVINSLEQAIKLVAKTN